MTGSCRPGKQEHKSSDPLALEQFLSAFLLLMAGILLAGISILTLFPFPFIIIKHIPCILQITIPMIIEFKKT